MTKINIQSPGGILEDGNLRIKDGLPIDGTLQTVSDVAANDSALQISTDEVGVSKSAIATTQDTAVIRSVDTNAGIAIVPNGTGAITAQVPDGTTVGGNARGANAVDLQMSRNLADQVAASPNSVISGGSNNRIRATTNTTSVIGGGDSNLISCSGSGTNNTIGGGFSNSITGGNSNWNIISGGASNSISSIAYGTISGGQSNTVSTGTHATVVGGSSNTSSGQYSVSGGRSSQATGNNSVALGGTALASNTYASAFGSATASGVGSFAGGGFNDSTAPIASGSYSTAFGYASIASGNTSFAVGEGAAYNRGSVAMGGIVDTGGDYSFVVGDRVGTYLYGQYTTGGGRFSVSKDAQQSILVARKAATLNSAATTVLSLDGTGVTNLIIPFGVNRLWAAKVTATAFVSAVSGTTLVLGDSYMGEYTILFKRVGFVSSVVGVTGGAIISDTNMSTAAFNFSAGASQELSITFVAPTTASADTFRCVAKVELVEVAY